MPISGQSTITTLNYQLLYSHVTVYLPCTYQGREQGRSAGRVFCAMAQGNKKYMEDYVVIDESEGATGQVLYAVFDGHGGDSSARYANDNLWSKIKSRKGSEDDVTQAIIYGFSRIHVEMREEMLKLKGAVYFI